MADPAMQRSQPPGKTRARPWAIAGAMAGAFVIALVLMLALRGGSRPGGETAQTGAAASGPPAAAPTTTAPSAPATTEPPEPGAPAPCDPSQPLYQCFPADQVTGAEFLARIADKEEWECLQRGERDDFGNEVTVAGECKGGNTVDQPYNIFGTVGYETHTMDDTGTMNEVKIRATVGANLDQGQDVTDKHVDRVLKHIFAVGVTHLWPDHEGWQADARRAFKKAWRQCRSEQGAEAVERTPVGYEVACSGVGAGTVVVQGPDGQSKTITESVSIQAPMPEGLDGAAPPPPPPGQR